MNHAVQDIEHWLVLILLFPAVGAIINGLLGSRLPRPVVSVVGCLASGLAFLFAVLAVNALMGVPGRQVLGTPLAEWMGFASDTANAKGDGLAWSFGVNVAFALDSLSATLLLVVTGVGFLIHLFSTGYMAGDPGYHRYFAYLNLFLFAMLILILGDNLVLMFVGWEGVGLASYLLIGFWFKDLVNASAGKKAFIVNRVGDFAFLLGIFLTVNYLGTTNFAEINASMASSGAGGTVFLASMMGLLFFIGACGKSAQIPLHVWLPDAMAGPTPVSALIHAATMVTAGVYMVGRLGAVFAAAPMVLEVVCLVGAITALVAATIGLVQNDIKKVLAYSTVSQLGYMFIGMGLGPAGYPYGIFHLVTHAFFKALLFLAAGAVIHACHHEQDMRRMGGLRTKMPLTFASFVVGALALSGVPPFSGFWSKDAILHHTLEVAIASHGADKLIYGIAFIFGLVAAVLTAFYITRLVAMTFLGRPRSDAVEHAHEVGGWMRFVLVVLFVLSLGGGWALQGGWSEWLAPVWEGLAPVAGAHAGHGGDGGDSPAKHFVEVASILAALLGIAVAWMAYVGSPGTARAWAEASPARVKLHALLLNKYYFDEFYQKHIVSKLDAFAGWLHRWIDVAVVDGVLAGDFPRGAKQMGKFCARLQSGSLGRYAGLFALGALIIMGYALFHGQTNEWVTHKWTALTNFLFGRGGAH